MAVAGAVSRYFESFSLPRHGGWPLIDRAPSLTGAIRKAGPERARSSQKGRLRMVTIALLRGLDRKRFDGRHDYYAHGPAASFANSAGELVCGVLQKSVKPSELVLALAGTSRWKHFPWVTPVLGSGCVQMTERSRAKLLVLAYQLEYQVHDIIKSDKTAGEGRVEVDGVEPRQLAGMAKRFTDALIRDRLQHNRSSSAGSAIEIEDR